MKIFFHVIALCRRGFPFSQDLPFNVAIGTPARDIVNDTTISASTSRRLVTSMANEPSRKAPEHPNSPKIEHFGSFSMHPERRFLLGRADFREIPDHPVLTSSGLALNRLIRSRICRKGRLKGRRTSDCAEGYSGTDGERSLEAGRRSVCAGRVLVGGSPVPGLRAHLVT